MTAMVGIGRGSRWLARGAGALLLALALLPFAAPGTALAHERRQVGPYTFVVGFLGEPALQGEPNGIDLRISRTDGGTPVEGADKTLKAAIAFGGGQPKEFPLRARFGMPGAYTADLIPTKAGSYIFTFSGTIDGNAVNEKFESGPGRFDDVKAADQIQFPEAVPAASQLAGQVQDAQAQAAAAQGEIAQARTLAVLGIVVGLLGLATAAWALVSARAARRGAAGGPAVAGAGTAPARS